MSKNLMFHIPLFSYRFANWSSKFKEEVLNQLERSPLKKKNRVQTDYVEKRENRPPYKEFISGCIEDKLMDFCQEIKIPRHHLVIDDMWYETAKQYDNHAVHNHRAYGYSACWYVDFDNTKHTSTKFYAPFNNFLTGFNMDHQPNVIEGDLVLFPSSIMHENVCNESSKKRTVVSFNVSIDLKKGD